MTIQEKLKSYKDKINNAKELNSELKNLIGIELFDFIHSNDLLKSEFERRRNYLKNLADDTGFNAIQDNLFETIQKILKLTSLEEVQERQKEWQNALFNRLKNSVKREERVPDTLTLPEMYVALQDKNNYYRLKDNSYYSPFDGEISLTNHIVPVKKQYEVIVEGFFREIFLSKPISDEKKSSQFKSLINEYNNYWYKFDELIYRIPVKLHFKSFENFFSDCTEFCIREGYEFHYNFFANSNSRNTEARLIKVKKDAITVIDDLTEFSDTQTDNSLPQKYLNPVVQAEETARKKMQAFGEQLDKSFARDKQNIEISRAWFEAISNSLKPQVEAYQTYVAQTLINLEPFRRRLEENAKIISNISERMIMPNLEAIRPMLTEIEKSLNSVSKFYVPPQKLTITAPLPPRMSETIQRNEIIKEIKTLRQKVEELTTPPILAQKSLARKKAIKKIFENNREEMENIAFMESIIDEKLKGLKNKPDNIWLIHSTKDKRELKFNKANGNFVFGKVNGNFAPDTYEYKIILKLLQSDYYMAKYDILLKELYPNRDFSKSIKMYPIERDCLTTSIKKIKNGFKILPKKKASNKDIFLVRKAWKGYQLDLTE